MKTKSHKDLVNGWVPFTEKEIEKYTSNGIWRNETTCDLLDRNAEMLPDKIAIIDDDCEITWNELSIGSKRMAFHLLNLGVEYGDFFVLQMANSVEFLYMLYGLQRIGAIPVLCIPRHRRMEVSHEISLHQAKGIAVMVREKFDYEKMVEDIKEDHPCLKIFLVTAGTPKPGWHSVEEMLKQEVEKDHPEEYLDQLKPSPNDLCAIQLSGGTSGVPKGIPTTYNHYISYCDYNGRAFGYTEDSVILIATPVGHGVPFILLYGPALYRGATVVMTKSSLPQDLFGIIEKHGVTHAVLMGIQLIYLKEAEEISKKYNLRSFSVLGVGGQKLDPKLVEWAIDEFGVNLLQLFGMTEGPVLFNRWDSPKECQMHTIGRPVITDPANVVKLVDDNNTEVGIGEVGEMVSKGPIVFKGYFRAEEENEKAFDEQGFFHSGDLMSTREDGRFVFEGRKKYMIKRGGENVYPEAVEALVMGHPDVDMCAMVGIPDARLAERLCAFIQPLKGKTITLDDIKAHLEKEGLAIFQWPERLEIVDGWPLSASNKINRRMLKAHICTKLFQEGAVDKDFANWYLKLDKISVDEVLSGQVKIEFIKPPT